LLRCSPKSACERSSAAFPARPRWSWGAGGARSSSPKYADIPEVERQSQAWGLVLDNLSDAEAAQVSFVYTNTPEEKAQAERDAAAGRGDG